MRALLVFLIAVFTAGFVAAQDRPNTILVLDGSGSMWGQIDGIAKITIAQEVVTDLLQTLPADERLGLIAYGHRERGNCTDIETLVPPAPGTRDAIAAAVAGIKPLGKTPMTDSVIAAADALRYTEDSATVILISDGVETCNPDPCAAARLLEEAGIDFTAHVIGFDVSGDAEALAQMQCIADETGGQFLSASNASELSSALTTVVEEPEPTIVTVTFQAVLGSESGPLITDPVIWTLSDASDNVAENPTTLQMEPGAYTVTAYRVVDERDVSVDFILTEAQAQTVQVVFPEVIPEMALLAPAQARLGETIDIGWSGQAAERDYIAVADPALSNYINYGDTRDGNPTKVQMPPAPGTYELRYHRQPGAKVIATKMIEVLPIEVTLDAADSAPKGSLLNVTWTGPNYQGDYISVAEVGSKQYINYANTRDGSPVALLMPPEPGTYEIRYVLRQDSTVLATVPITVTDLAVSVTAPDTAPVGSKVTVGWDGPDYQGDYISVAEVGSKQYINYTNTRDGNPLQLLMPVDPGSYEIRYVLRQDSEVLATRMIEVVPIEVSINAVAEAPAGSLVAVDWSGPGYEGDYISVGEPGNRQYINYTNVRDGNPVQLLMPVAPGTYEIRYQLRQDSEVVATRTITTTALKPEMTLPDTAIAGATVNVIWTGPDYQGDYISVGEPGSQQYINYTLTRDGSPLPVLMPPIPGDYEVRYQLRQDSAIILRKPITILPLKAQLVAEPTTSAGADVVVGWDGPDYTGDYIAISKVGDRGYERYTLTRDGNPLTVRAPDTPGEYELRYMLRQDATVVARIPLTVTD